MTKYLTVLSLIFLASPTALAHAGEHDNLAIWKAVSHFLTHPFHLAGIVAGLVGAVGLALLARRVIGRR